MLKTMIVCAAAIGWFCSEASAAALIQPQAFPVSDNLVSVKVICEQDGYCYHRGRRPVVRWVYGDRVFYGPYVGPGYYGWPGSHNGWWPFVGY
jgi:hypothetical protein